MTHPRLVIGPFMTFVGAVALTGGAALAFQGPEKNQGKSLLTNGGFEEGDSQGDAPDGWKTGGIAFGPLRLVEPPGNVKYQWDRKFAHQGSASLHLSKKVKNYLPPWGQFSQEVKRTGTSPCIKVRAFVKAKKATKAILNVQFLDGSGQCVAQTWAVYIGSKTEGDPPRTTGSDTKGSSKSPREQRSSTSRRRSVGPAKSGLTTSRQNTPTTRQPMRPRPERLATRQSSAIQRAFTPIVVEVSNS